MFKSYKALEWYDMNYQFKHKIRMTYNICVMYYTLHCGWLGQETIIADVNFRDGEI